MPSFFPSKKNLNVPLVMVSLILLGIFFSYRILLVPPGLTADEVAFGYNAALLADTGRDETGRTLPFFVLSLDGNDWRQPITQYYLTFLFKIFPRSLYLMRFSSVLITLASTFLMFITAREVFKNVKYATVACVLFISIPLVMIQTHYALDNIMTIPFTLLWMYGLIKYHQKPQIRKLFVSAVSLGIGFYSYKAMRAIVPIWSIITVGYLIYLNSLQNTLIRKLKPAVLFSLFISPFFLIIPLLELKYAGAVFDSQQHSRVSSVYDFLYPYLSSFDPTFLFITGDELIFHSTGHHGMFLVATLPLFILGIVTFIRKPRFLLGFIILAFFIAPLLFGLVNSVHRASRLMAIIPLFVLISTYGIKWLASQSNQTLSGKLSHYGLYLIILLMIINYLDFLNYYWYKYPLALQGSLGTLQDSQAYQQLAQLSQQQNRQPYISQYLGEKMHYLGKLYQELYFSTDPHWINPEALSDPQSIILDQREQIKGLQLIDQPYPGYYIHVPQ